MTPRRVTRRGPRRRGHPRLSWGLFARETWMAGTSPAMTREKWLPRRLQIRLRRRFVPDWRHLVGIDAHHQVVDVIVDLGEPMPGAGWDDDHVAGLELVGCAISNR